MAVRTSPVFVTWGPTLAAWLFFALLISIPGCQILSQASPAPAIPSLVPYASPTPSPTDTVVGADTPDARDDFGSLVVHVDYVGSNTIWLLAGDQAPRLLTAGKYPDLSPDGCSMIFTRDTEDPPYHFEYVVIDVDKSIPGFLLSPYDVWKELVYGMAWSPDSKSLALTTGGDIKKYYRGDLWLVDASDGTMTQLAESGAGEPLFSPDGKWIATFTPWMGWNQGTVGLWSVEEKSGGTLFGPLWRHSLKWADDSSGFAAALNYDGGPGMELWWIPVDAAPMELGHLPNAMYVSWQPGAERLVWCPPRFEPDAKYRTFDGPYNLHLANRDGSEDVMVPGSEGMTAQSWSPDGRWLLTVDGDGLTYILDAETLQFTLLPNVGRIHRWLDAGHYLASRYQRGTTELYRCVPPATCQFLVRLDGEIRFVGYTNRVCAGVRWEAVGVRGRIEPVHGDISVLVETLLGDKDHGVRGQAAFVLAEIGPVEVVVPALIQAVEDDPHMRWAVAEALWKIGPAAAEAVPALLRALEDECAAEMVQACYVERHAIARALRAVTGQDFAEDPSAWQAWWEGQR